LLIGGNLVLSASGVLDGLDTDGPGRLTALAAAAGLSQPALTQLVQRFERRGIVSRMIDLRDRRAAVIAITDAGREIVRQRRGYVRQRLAELVTALHPDGQAALELAALVTLPLITRLKGAERKGDSQRSIA
jgi:DNA-binding MarR family transcriptional regulator